MVDAGKEASRVHQREQALELGSHGGLAEVHHQLVVVAYHPKLRIRLAQRHAIDGRLPFEREHALDSD